MLLAIGVYQLLMHIMVILGKQKKIGLKTLELSTVDPEIPNFLIGIYLSYMEQVDMKRH